MIASGITGKGIEKPLTSVERWLKHFEDYLENGRYLENC
jgi:uncharacterized protein YbgA (DUF1722 family)